MSKRTNNVGGVNINAVLHNSEVRKDISKEDLIKFIQKGSRTANDRIKRIENKYGKKNASNMSIQYKNLQNDVYNAKKISAHQGKSVAYKGVLQSGKFSKETKGMSYEQLSYKAKRLGYFLKGETSTIGGINEHWSNIKKGIKESRAFNENTKKYLLSLDHKKLGKLWELLDHGNKYDSDTVINIIEKMENNGVSMSNIKKSLDEMFEKDLTQNEMMTEVTEHIDAIKNGTYEYNSPVNEITDSDRQYISDLFGL